MRQDTRLSEIGKPKSPPPQFEGRRFRLFVGLLGDNQQHFDEFDLSVAHGRAELPLVQSVEHKLCVAKLRGKCNGKGIELIYLSTNA